MTETPDLHDYWLVRCFECKQYLDDLINGKCLHMNSVQKFRESSNKFQGDPNDCAVIVDNEHLQFQCFTGKDAPDEHIGDIDLSTCAIDGYLYCFFAIPKEFFKIEDDEVYADEESPYYAKFYQYMDEYKANCKDQKCYVGLFDAAAFVHRLEYVLKGMNISYTYGFVTYRKLSSAERMHLFVKKQAEQIVLTKDPSYSYQNEFRFFARTKQDIEDWFQITGLKLSDIMAMRFEY